MIRTFIRLQLSSEGDSPKQLVERVRKIGGVPVMGDYDFEITLGEDQRLFDKLEEIHNALKGSNVRYTVTTRAGAESEGSYSGRKVTHYIDQKPTELRRSLYKAKLERWKEMGLDVSELEVLIDEDLDKFKAASREFLRTHLDRLSIVQDKRPQENRIDGEILALLDEDGKTLRQIAEATGLFEDQVTLSLGRLISSGSVRRVVPTDGSEIFCLIPPPAPQIRKAIEVIPAKDDEEAKARAFELIPPEGVSSKDLVKSAKLPRDQLKKALETLNQENKIRVERRGKKDWYFRA